MFVDDEIMAMEYNNITYANETNYLFLEVSYETIVNTINQGNNEFDSILLLNWLSLIAVTLYKTLQFLQNKES